MRHVWFMLMGMALLLVGCEEIVEKPPPHHPPARTDTAPSFSETVIDQAYLIKEVVSLTLPLATGGNGSLTYSLTPEVPGLTFAAATRTLSGTPSSAGTYDMTYQAADGDDNTAASDAATLSFTITVQEPEPPDTAPTFAGMVRDQTYTEGEAIGPLTLPRASGGNGSLSYSLTPEVPGLTFAAATRTLSGTPSVAGTYTMTYTVVDDDENMEQHDAASQGFTIAIQAPCPEHSVTQIVGDWTNHGGLFFPSGWVVSFRADGIFQINYGDVDINNEPKGNYSYDATACTLTWRGTEPDAEPSMGLTTIGSVGTVTIRGINEHFVDWDGPDSFCERASADSASCINTYTRPSFRSLDAPPEWIHGTWRQATVAGNNPFTFRFTSEQVTVSDTLGERRHLAATGRVWDQKEGDGGSYHFKWSGCHTWHTAFADRCGEYHFVLEDGGDGRASGSYHDPVDRSRGERPSYLFILRETEIVLR